MAIKRTPADIAFSLCVREAWDWTCCRCGTTYHHNHGGLDCSHGHGRGQWAVRFCSLNARPACMGCHLREGGLWMNRLLSEWERDRLDELRHDVALGKLARKTKGKGPIAKHYREQYDQIRALRECGVTGYIPFEDYY